MHFEDKHKLRASLVLHFYYNKLKTIDPETIGLPDRERRDSCLKLIDTIS